MKDQENSIKPIDAKSADNNSIKGYFKSIFPEFDEERVYVSDMKKMLKWFEILKANDLLNFEYLNAPAEEETAPAAETVAVAEEVAEEKPAKKSRAKKAAEPTAEGEEKPKKKAAKKKTEE
jgi:hypothetical protein